MVGGRGKGKSFKKEAQKNSWALMRGCIKLHVVCKPGMNEKEYCTLESDTRGGCASVHLQYIHSIGVHDLCFRETSERHGSQWMQNLQCSGD